VIVKIKYQGSYRSGKTGKSRGNCVIRERSAKNIIFEKSGKMICIMQTADICDFFCLQILNKKFEIMFTRHAKAYNSSGSVV